MRLGAFLLSQRIGPRLTKALIAIVLLSVLVAVIAFATLEYIEKQRNIVLDEVLPVLVQSNAIELRLTKLQVAEELLLESRELPRLDLHLRQASEEIERIRDIARTLVRQEAQTSSLRSLDDSLSARSKVLVEAHGLVQQSIGTRAVVLSERDALAAELESIRRVLEPLSLATTERLVMDSDELQAALSESSPDASARLNELLTAVTEDGVVAVEEASEREARRFALYAIVGSLSANISPESIATLRSNYQLQLRALVQLVAGIDDDAVRRGLSPAMAVLTRGGVEAGNVFDQLLTLQSNEIELKRLEQRLASLSARSSEQVQSLVEQARQLAQATRLAADRSANVGRAWIGGLVVVVIVFATVVTWGYVLPRIVRPMQSLTDAALDVSEGDWHRPVTTEGEEELQRLAGAIRQFQYNGLELERQRMELQRSNLELEQFAYVASHDLQEPLRTVASYCDLIERRYGDKLDEDGHQFIAFAVEGAKRMQQLIQDILAFSRVGRRELSIAQVPFERVVEEATFALNALISETGARVEYESLPAVNCDVGAMRLALQNLISNSIKFCEASTPVVRISAEVGDGRVRFWFEDNGIGIEPRFAERIFEVFRRLHGREDYEGTGIGLAIVKRVVERHGGEVWLEEKAPPGARFCISLPHGPEVAASP